MRQGRNRRKSTAKMIRSPTALGHNHSHHASPEDNAEDVRPACEPVPQETLTDQHRQQCHEGQEPRHARESREPCLGFARPIADHNGIKRTAGRAGDGRLTFVHEALPLCCNVADSYIAGGTVAVRRIAARQRWSRIRATALDRDV